MGLGGAIGAGAVIASLIAASAPALAARGHSFSAFGAPCAEEPCGDGQFNEPAGVAVRDTTGDVYVVDRGDNRVERFSAAGPYLSQFAGAGTPAKSFSSPEAIAVDNSSRSLLEDPSEGDVYVLDAGHDVVDKFNATGAYIGQLTETPNGAFGALDGVGVDPNGTVWVYQASGEIDSFKDGAANEFLESRMSAFPSTAPGFAVDSEEHLYVAHTAEAPAEVVLAQQSASGASLIEALDVERTTGAAVESASDDVYVDNVATVAVFSAAGELIERFGSGQLGSGAGLAVYPKTGAVYVADAATDAVDAFVPEPPSQPSASSLYATNVTESGSDLHAEVDPHGADTTYRFRYGTVECTASPSSCTSIPAPPGNDVGSSYDSQPATVHLQELTPGTTYHYRVIAKNRFGEIETASSTFTTISTAGAFALPDGRAWEMVSPIEKHGGVVQPLASEEDVQASAAGGALTYLTDQSLFKEPQGESNFSQVLAMRNAAGWSSQDITTPSEGPSGEVIGRGEEYQIFSPDLSLALVQPHGPFTPLSPTATERTPYRRVNSAPVCDTESVEQTCYTPLLTAANVPPGTKFGGDPNDTEGTRVHVLDASPDLSHVVLKAEAGVSLTSTPAETGGLYEWAEGHLDLISALPENAGAALDARLGYQNKDVRNAISEDGSRVFWEDDAEQATDHLYVTDVTTGRTAQIDTVQSGSGEGENQPRFQIATTDGSRVFFLDSQQLTEGSHPHGGFDLYECKLVEVAGSLSCELNDLTTPPNPEEPAEVHGSVIGMGSDEHGLRLYVLALGVLAVNANEATGETPIPGAENLYVLHESGGSWTSEFIATRSPSEGEPHNRCNFSESTARCMARVSPNGRYLAFMSQASLTGYDNADANSGRPDEEVYLYDSEAPSDRLRCVSCSPTGGRPVGTFEQEAFKQLRLVDYRGQWQEVSLAALLPGWDQNTEENALYQPRYLSSSGRLFFDSSEALVPQDVNGQWDVYEYEPAEAGSCHESSGTFSAKAHGCLGLISSGTSSEESAFLDASESGGDVFFITSARLGPQDSDEQRDVYDAHECTSGSPCTAPSASTAPGGPSTCRTGPECWPASPTSGPLAAAPLTSTFSGPGNALVQAPGAAPKPTRAQKLAKALRSCRSRYRRSKRRRTACEARARESYGAHARKKATHKASRGRA